MRMIMGIDPGKTGAIAIYSISPIDDPPPLLFRLDKMTEHDVAATVKRFNCADACYIEKVGARPGQGVTSMFNFGKTTGFLQGLVIANGIPLYEVTPQTWQAHHGLRVKNTQGFTKTERKRKNRNYAERIFPGIKFTNDTAEALLIAKYGYDKQFGGK